MPLPKIPVTIGFHPKDLKDPGMKALWKDPIARKLWLLWKPCHVTTNSFVPEVMYIASIILDVQPKDYTELLNCFVLSASPLSNFMKDDVETFCRQTVRDFTEDLNKPIKYTVPGQTELMSAEDLRLFVRSINDFLEEEMVSQGFLSLLCTSFCNGEVKVSWMGSTLWETVPNEIPETTTQQIKEEILKEMAVLILSMSSINTVKLSKLKQG